MNAVIYGGGNIGRGFVGALLSGAGYHVTFVDVSESVVNALHSEGNYPVRIVDSDGYEDIEISNVDAVNGRDANAVAELISQADIMATAVGVGALKFIIPNIVTGIRKRFSVTDKPLDIIICENLMDANKIIEGMIKEHLTEEEQLLFDKRIGLVEASIGRMVPVQTKDMQDGNPLRVCVERYGALPVDKDAFKGAIPHCEQLVPASPFDFYIKRKLFLHNMGHALCAYMGLYAGAEYIYESIDDPNIYIIVKNAMLESVEALCTAYGKEFGPLLHHADDLLFRFTNRALADTCARVGQDIPRKLSPEDRLIGAMKLCLEHGIFPAYMAIGAAGAVHRHLGKEQGLIQAAKTLKELSHLEENDSITRIILDMYDLFLVQAAPERIRKTAEQLNHSFAQTT